MSKGISAFKDIAIEEGSQNIEFFIA